MPAAKRPKLPRELFETRTHAWQSLGLGEEIETRAVSKRSLVGLVVAVLVLIATLVVYSHRRQIAPGYGEWFRIGTVIVLVLVGGAAVHWFSRSLSPRLYRRLDPATAGTVGFVFRLLAMLTVVVVALRIAGVQASTLAVGGAFTAVLPRGRSPDHASLPGRRTGAPRRRRPGRLAGGHGHLARPLLHHPQPGGRPPADPQQRAVDAGGRAAARAGESRRQGAPPAPGEP